MTITHSDELGELFTAVASFQASMDTVGKGSVNPFFNSSYADLASILKEALPLTSGLGLAVLQFPGHVEQTDSLVTWIGHTSGQWIREEMLLHLSKVTPQDQGSAITYGKRYAFQGALGISTDKDDDGNASSVQQPRAAAAAAPAPAGVAQQVAQRAASAGGSKAQTTGQGKNAYRLSKKLEEHQGWSRSQYLDAVELFGGEGVRDDRNLTFDQISGLIKHLMAAAGEEDQPREGYAPQGPPPSEPSAGYGFDEEPF